MGPAPPISASRPPACFPHVYLSQALLQNHWFAHPSVLRIRDGAVAIQTLGAELNDLGIRYRSEAIIYSGSCGSTKLLDPEPCVSTWMKRGIGILPKVDALIKLTPIRLYSPKLHHSRKSFISDLLHATRKPRQIDARSSISRRSAERIEDEQGHIPVQAHSRYKVSEAPSTCRFKRL